MESAIEHYFVQGLLASFIMLITLYLITLEHAFIMVSMGATAFIIFAMPNSPTAKPKNILGGHMLGLLSGTLFSLVPRLQTYLLVLACSLAVGLSIICMTLTKTHHPPASGTALAVVLTGFSIKVLLGVILGSALLSLTHHALRRYLKDL
ncbi:HPP family protein [Candidatus Bathyarchaeota archaeon ex4484_135]|nr:MAG: HPP family protein [Candidatus Bathyarchaeota archaeon ex4484_135]